MLATPRQPTPGGYVILAPNSEVLAASAGMIGAAKEAANQDGQPNDVLVHQIHLWDAALP